MTFNQYQAFTGTTAIYPKDFALPYVALGFSGEAGEIANKAKKVIRDDNGVITESRRLDLIDELGDALYYASELATVLGVTLEEVIKGNVAKLTSRQARGVLGGSGDAR